MSAQERYAAQARAIADALAQASIGTAERATWLHTPESALPAAGGQAQCVTANASLYNGLAGVAFFLHQAGTRLENPGHVKLANRAIRQALWQLHAGNDLAPGREASASPRSFFMGDLGVAWVAWTVGLATSDGWLLGAASDVIERLDRAAPKGPLDFVTGLGGTIGPLLQLEAAGLPGAGRLARRHAAACIRAAKRDGDLASWTPDIPATRPLTGLSHGSSGFGLALALHHQATGDAVARALAVGAFAHEDLAYDAARGNWPDFRQSAQREGAPAPLARAWCHGAPGIGVARALAARAGIPTPEDKRKAALWTTMDATRAALDDPDAAYQLCHGVLGLAECALAMAEDTGERDVVRRLAQDVADGGLARYGDPEDWTIGPMGGWNTGAPGMVNVGLLTGLAGVGLYYLRMADPRAPSILALAGMGADAAAPSGS